MSWQDDPIVQAEQTQQAAPEGGGGGKGSKAADSSMNASFWDRGGASGRKASRSVGQGFLADDDDDMGKHPKSNFWSRVKKWFRPRKRVVTNGKRALHPSNSAAIILVRTAVLP